jgi:hypothetical protein
MSGVDVSERQKENQVNVCESCMTSVVQTFRHLQDEIGQLRQQKVTLQLDHEKQMQVLTNKIRVLEEKLAALKDQ